jgi:glycosyltransferase involved in cell wall biosynthesis
MRFPFHPGLLPATPGLLGHPALSEADVIQVAEFHQLATLFSCITARDYSVPVVVWQETFRRMRFPGSLYQHAYESTVGRYVRARARRFIPRTTKARSYLRELRVADDRIGPWIPTGINVDAFASRKTRMSAADLGWPEGSPILLLVGRLHPTKGIDVALRTLRWVIRKHANAKLVVRGSGPERANLLQLARELHVEGAVRIIDRMPREAMVDLYNLADVVLCTSRVDLMPFSLIEASACCRPAVATDVGAIRDIVVDGRSGFVVEPGNIEAIGSAVSSLLADEGLRRAMGTEARHIAEQRFALPVVAGKLLQVYRNVAV